MGPGHRITCVEMPNGYHTMQYIPRILLLVRNFFYVWHRSILPISLKIASMALGQSYDYPQYQENDPKNMGKLISRVQWELTL